jgi:hypothetical protein
LNDKVGLELTGVDSKAGVEEQEVATYEDGAADRDKQRVNQ